MGKSRAAKDRNTKRSNKKRKLAFKPKKKPHSHHQQNQNPIQVKDTHEIATGVGVFSGDDGGSSSPSSPSSIHRLLEPYSKDQLISFLIDAAADDPALLSSISAAADTSVAHRKLFVHGLGWDATRETLLHAFEPYGPLEDCNVVVDKSTGRSKGFGFVLFRTRAAAACALREPQKKIKNRVAFCQLASVGPVAGGGAASASGLDTAGRRIYVSNVHEDAQPDKLKALFTQFGDIEAGPIGFNMYTGKSRGFALFVYKTVEGARRALEEPHKMFEGRLLHCQLATDSSQKGKAAAAATNIGAAAAAPLTGAASQPMLAAVAAAQNLLLQGQNPNYAMLLGQNPLLAAAALNPAAFASLNPTALAALNPAAVGALYPTAGLVAPQSQPLGGVGLGGGAPSLLGAYGFGSQGQVGLQGLQGYQRSLGQSATTRPGGSFGGFPSYP
ncbi:UBP1-associated protein 2A-like [Typha latifolia]|uniref:UBP1-associated protein 2A-like n=1 Tax=Typha latifolia TaxID=4733 RepID=UPI003C2E5773